jgi:hypothetical protein
MKICLSHTCPINPPDAPIKLTRAQVWEGIKLKARDPLKFVPIIAKCEVVEEHEEGLTRVVEFKTGTGPPGRITEVVTYAPDVQVSKNKRASTEFLLTVPSIG